MYAVSKDFLNEIQSNNRTFRWSGNLITNTGKTIPFTNKDIVKNSGAIVYQCCDDNALSWGGVYAAELSISLYLSIDRYRLFDGKITLDFELLVNGAYEKVPMGVFYISEAVRHDNYLELKSYDGMVLFDKDFSSTTSGAVLDIIKLCCAACGVELGQSDEELTDMMLTPTITVSTYKDNDIATYRDILFYLAQSQGWFCAMDRTGKLVFREYNMTPQMDLGAGFRFRSEYADYETSYTAIRATKQRKDKSCYYALDEDNGLTYNLGANPFMQYKVESNYDKFHKALLKKISAVKYVPFETETIGNPALDVGDCLSFHDRHADESKKSCATKIELKINGRMTIKGVGENPRLNGMKSRTDKSIEGLRSSAQSNTLVYYSFVNASRVTVKDTRTKALSIVYETVQDTSAMFMAAMLMHVVPDEGATPQLTVTYNQNSSDITDFIPREIFPSIEADHIINLYFPITDIEAGEEKIFSVFLELTGGTGTIEPMGIRATITGQGLAASDSESWDGTIEVKDDLERIPMSGTDEFQMKRMTDTVNLTELSPSGSQLTDQFVRLAMSASTFTLRGLTANLLLEPIIKTFTMNVQYPGQYDPMSVELASDNAFQLKRSSIYTSSEEEVSIGWMEHLHVDTTDFESVEGHNLLVKQGG